MYGATALNKVSSIVYSIINNSIISDVYLHWLKGFWIRDRC